MKSLIISIKKPKRKKMKPQIEGKYKCFICNILKDHCKIIKNQDSDDAVCKEDFIRLCTDNTTDYIQIHTSEEAEKLWNGIQVDGSLPFLS